MNSSRLTKWIFAVYLIILTWGILFKFETQLAYLPIFVGPRIVNWIPFSEPLVVNGDVVFAEMGFNILAFLPFGLCLPLIKANWSFWKIAGAGFLLSLLYETLQFILTIGMADVTDLLMNTLGALCGLGIFALLRQHFPTKVRTIVNSLGVLVGELAILGLAALFILGI